MQTNARKCVLAICLLCTNLLLCTPAWGQELAVRPRLNIVIVEGEGAINNVKQRVNREPIVQVEDENHRPIAGAVVTFFLPENGPSGVFANGSKSVTLTTDAQGRAAATSIRRNDVSGQMQIRVTASFAGQTATAIISQTSIASATPSAGLSTTAKVLLIVGIAGGATAGAIVATRSGSSSSTNPASSPIVITAGTATVGIP